MTPEVALEIINNYFQLHFSSFDKIKEITRPPFWYIEFEKEATRLIIEGDAGFNVNIKIDGKDFLLWSFDKRVNNATKANKKNILFVLDILKKFLN